MELSQVKAAIIGTPKGANIILEHERDCKVRKGVAESIRKHVRTVGRIGIEYNNVAAVQEKRRTDELPAEPQPLPWGQWSEYPYLIEHKGTYYIRLYRGTSPLVKPKTFFLLNGKEIDKSEIEEKLLASEKRISTADTITVKVKDILQIHHEIEKNLDIEMETDIGTETEKTDINSKPLPF
jgi:hypothetical protein